MASFPSTINRKKPEYTAHMASICLAEAFSFPRKKIHQPPPFSLPTFITRHPPSLVGYRHPSQGRGGRGSGSRGLPSVLSVSEAVHFVPLHIRVQLLGGGPGTHLGQCRLQVFVGEGALQPREARPGRCLLA